MLVVESIADVVDVEVDEATGGRASAVGDPDGATPEGEEATDPPW